MRWQAKGWERASEKDAAVWGCRVVVVLLEVLASGFDIVQWRSPHGEQRSSNWGVDGCLF